MKGFPVNNSVILTAIKYSCNPDNYLIRPLQIPFYTLYQTEIMLIPLNCWILLIIQLLVT